MNKLQGLNSLYRSFIEKPTAGSPILKPEHDAQTTALDFSGELSKALGALEDKQFESSHAVQGLMEGTADDMHTVMIKTTEAQLSLELAVQMRTKVLEAYNEIKNIQF